VTPGTAPGASDAAHRRDDVALDKMYAEVEAYYADRLARHGATPRGVDWSCAATQWLRFVQLLKVCSFGAPFSLIDLGCGYGALPTFLAERHADAEIDYLGIDLSPAMIARARRRHRGKPTIRFAVGRNSGEQADYVIASGIMNVMLGHSLPIWERFVRTVLLDIHRMGRQGFAVNFLSAPTPGAPPGQLYCPDPATWVRFCRDDLGGSVEVLDAYGMREFTLLVRKTQACR